MRSARDIISWILIIAGVAILLFAMLWWTIAIKRLIRYPSGVDLSVACEGTIEQLAGKHGLDAMSPPRKEDLELSVKLTSVDGEYTSQAAVLDQETTRLSTADLGLEMGDSDTYVIDRGECENIKSDLSRSSGTVVDRSGSWSVNFPLGTEKESYNVFNDDVASSFAVSFLKEKKIEGIGVYVFDGSFRHRPMIDYRVEARGLPATTTFGEMKAEIDAMGIPLDLMINEAYRTITDEEKEAISKFPDDRKIELEYTAKHSLEIAVEPVTGTVVDVDSETCIYVNTNVRAFLPLLEILAEHSEDPLVLQYMSQIEQQKILEPREVYRVSSGWTPESVLEMTDHANSRIGPIRFVRDVLTVMMLVLGAVCLVAGLVVRRERSVRVDGGEDDTGPAPEGGPVDQE